MNYPQFGKIYFVIFPPLVFMIHQNHTTFEQGLRLKFWKKGNLVGLPRQGSFRGAEAVSAICVSFSRQQHGVAGWMGAHFFLAAADITKASPFATGISPLSPPAPTRLQLHLRPRHNRLTSISPPQTCHPRLTTHWSPIWKHSDSSTVASSEMPPAPPLVGSYLMPIAVASVAPPPPTL